MTERKTSKGLHTALWVVQILLAAAFGMAGFMKITAPVDELLKNGMTFVNDYSVGMVRFIGWSELIGALGLILPPALRIKPILSVFAAAGIAIIMVMATIYHISHKEPFIATILFFGLALFVIWGRIKNAPIQEK